MADLKDEGARVASDAGGVRSASPAVAVMKNTEQAVRLAAAELAKAIDAARADGYRVEWPSNSQGLTAIAVSATDKVS